MKSISYISTVRLRDMMIERLWYERGYEFSYLNALTPKELLRLYDTEFYYE
jgi:hypothetical protein